jgi:hypothetical protein
MESVLTQLGEVGSLHTVVGFMATVLVFSWKLYQLPVLQSRIPVKLRWASLSPLRQFAVTGALSSAAGVLVALSTGLSGWELVRVVLGVMQSVMLGGVK